MCRLHGRGRKRGRQPDERPDPVPSGDDLLVAVRYAGLNPADLAQRAGRYPAPPGAPRTFQGSRSPAS